MRSKLVFRNWNQESRIKNQDFFLPIILSFVLALDSWLYTIKLYFNNGQLPKKKSFFGHIPIKFSILLLLASCGSYPRKNDMKEMEIATKQILNPYFSDPSKDYVYKAGITLQKKEFGGLFIVKKLGPDRHRVVFTTEMGNKILDFSFDGDRFTVNYLLEEMDKKILVNILKRDFRALITEDFPVLRAFGNKDREVFETKNDKKKYYYFYRDGQLEKIIRASGKKEKTEYLFSEVNDNTAERIGIAHKNIPLQINLFHINLKEIK